MINSWFSSCDILFYSLNTIATLYSIPYGLSSAVRYELISTKFKILLLCICIFEYWDSNVRLIISTRVSNELGAGNSQGARISVFTVMLLTVMEAILVSATLFGCRNIFGFVYSSEMEVVNYVAKIAPLLSLSVIMDGLQASLSG